jgi:two-component system sensor histidine kinase YesM
VINPNRTFHKFRTRSIKFKLLTIIALLILGSVFLESYLSYKQYTKDFERQSSAKVQQIIEQVSINIDTYLDDLFRLTLSPYRNEAIMSTLEEGTPGTELQQLDRRRLVENFLDEMMIYPRKDILRVSIVTDQIYSSVRIPSNVLPAETSQQIAMYKKALLTEDYLFVPAHMQPSATNGNMNVFSIVKPLRSTLDSQQVLGFIKVDANYNGIVDTCGKASMGQVGGLLVLDDKNNIIYTSNSRYNEMISTGSLIGDITTNAKHNGYMQNHESIPRVGWNVIAVNSVKEMNRQALATRNIAFVIAFCCCLFAIGVLILYIRRFLQPLLAIVHLMKQVERGNLSVRFLRVQHDEIGYLGRSFNTLIANFRDMLDKNTLLVKEVYEAKLLQQEAQINALFSQIRPHFIFNTLNMISLTMQSGQQDKAIDHINKLSSILRSMTAWDKEVPLERELELLRAYLSIQSSRYEGRLDYQIDIDPSLYHCPVPALLLQPIVENAVQYGCEEKKGKTKILIGSQVEEAEACIAFFVVDNGKGMDAGILASVQAKIEQIVPPMREGSFQASAHAGIGLSNVNKRIKAKYGADYGLTITSEPNVGTKVIIRLPLTICEERT